MGCTNSKTVDELSPSSTGTTNPLVAESIRGSASHISQPSRTPVRSSGAVAPATPSNTHPARPGTPMYTLPAGTGTVYYSPNGTFHAVGPGTEREVSPSAPPRRPAGLESSEPRSAARCTVSPKTHRRGNSRKKERTCLDAAWRAHMAAQLSDTMRTMGSLSFDVTRSSER
eukprot:CAMPEP_0174830048 /NCGR_PEP_ID=MMETSP1114-20130205/2307_1 /TAXON_ID=312471 /ORGANISM="Neobodo designis, Strain CCAP 1951/1" /LENGTH=170 /DNA_ID=CAMNT_0016063831 /DNA_START=121 /DNA_END=633 /DNA_ORIENTATION=+